MAIMYQMQFGEPVILKSITKAFVAAEKIKAKNLNEYLIKFALIDSLKVAATASREATGTEWSEGWDWLNEQMDHVLCKLKKNPDFKKIVWATSDHIANMPAEEVMEYYNDITNSSFQDDMAPF